MTVAEADIRAAISEGATSIQAVGEACEAGTGCQTCHEAIAYMLEEHSRRELRSGRGPGALTQLSLFGGGSAIPRGAGRPPKERE